MITINNADVFYNESLKNRCTFKVGGRAKVLLCPRDCESFLNIIKNLRKTHESWFVLGGGSNIVPKDEDFDGYVLSTNNLNNIEFSDEILSCQCGTKIESIIQFCIENSISGLENFAGLPGTIGGAVYMNARCYDKSISDVLCGVDYIDGDKILHYDFDSKDWQYKKSPFQEKSIFNPYKIILKAYLKVKKLSSDNQIEQICQKYIDDRKLKGHFKYPSAGSVFKNNRNFNKPSGVIIDEVGLKGKMIGGAQVAPWHGNFIINIEDATSKDIKDLVESVKKEVFDKTGFLLECEIIFL